MDDDFTIDSKEFGDFYRAMSKIDPEVKKQLRKRLTDAAKPIVDEVRSVELQIPAKAGSAASKRKKRGETLGLRQSLAAATVSEIKATKRGGAVHIRVSTTRFMAASGRPRTLPYYMEGRRKRPWRHPVYGNKQNWVTQSPHPFLGVTVQKHKDEFEKEVTSAVLDAIASVKP